MAPVNHGGDLPSDRGGVAPRRILTAGVIAPVAPAKSAPMALRYQVASCIHASRKLSGLPHPTVIVWPSPLFFFPRTVRDWNILPEAPQLVGLLWNIAIMFGMEKLECGGCQWWKKFYDMFNHLDRIWACDRQTDVQTSFDSIVHAMHSIAW